MSDKAKGPEVTQGVQGVPLGQQPNFESGDAAEQERAAREGLSEAKRERTAAGVVPKADA